MNIRMFFLSLSLLILPSLQAITTGLSCLYHPETGKKVIINPVDNIDKIILDFFE